MDALSCRNLLVDEPEGDLIADRFAELLDGARAALSG
jgi:hypothetical protein